MHLTVMEEPRYQEKVVKPRYNEPPNSVNTDASGGLSNVYWTNGQKFMGRGFDFETSANKRPNSS